MIYTWIKTLIIVNMFQSTNNVQYMNSFEVNLLLKFIKLFVKHM